MRTIGRRKISTLAFTPSADALRQAAYHSATLSAVTQLSVGGLSSAVASVGIRKGVYRFSDHAARNQIDERAIAMQMATVALARFAVKN
jgi:hypothetical protein